jgi:hypothetical protein
MPVIAHLHGHGNQLLSDVALSTGMIVFHLTHNGDSNFSIWLDDPNGEHVDLLANSIGNTNETKPEGIKAAGNYTLDITANGDWSIDIGKPDPATATLVPPHTLVGHGQLVSPLIHLDAGLFTFTSHHSGKSNFAVALLDADGDLAQSLVIHIGHYAGAKTIRIENSGIYAVDVAADGDWVVDLVEGTPPPPVGFTRLAAGQGSQISPPFSLKGGLVTFRIHHTGKSNFDVWLLAPDGSRVDALAIEIGSYEGVLTLKIRDSGQYSVDVAADGSWTIDLTPIN